MNAVGFFRFDNACIAGDLATVKAMLTAESPTQSQLNQALRHAVAYTGPDRDTREDLVDALLDRNATVDWADRGIETLTNAVKSGSSYVLKRVLNACDGNVKKLTVAVDVVRRRKDTEWAMDLIERRRLGLFHVGL